MNLKNYKLVKEKIEGKADLVAVSKTKSADEVLKLYEQGQRHFGENYVQELCEKQLKLPNEIRWHFIGHLQTNKVKMILPFIHLIESIDSLKLLTEINKQSQKAGIITKGLLQFHLSEEESKFGLNQSELTEIINQYNNQDFKHITLCGMMAMSSLTDNMKQVEFEFEKMNALFQHIVKKVLYKAESFNTLSMGMSGDFELAIKHGSNSVRIGSLIFGERV